MARINRIYSFIKELNIYKELLYYMTLTDIAAIRMHLNRDV